MKSLMLLQCWSSVLLVPVLLAGIHCRLLEFEPSDQPLVTERERIDVRVGLNDTALLSANDMFRLRLQIRYDWQTRAVLLNDSLNLTAEEPFRNFTVEAIFIGYAFVEFTSCDREICSEDDFEPTNQTYEIAIIRRPWAADTAFTVLVFCLIVIANLGMGCSVDLDVVREVLRRPTGPVIGFCCQFFIMPPLAFLIASLFNLSVAEKLGLLAIGSSPGGGPSNMWTLILDGDLNLSITMTVISTVASLAMFPLWMFTLGKVIMGDAEFALPFQNILASLLSAVIPVAIGLLIQRCLPRVAKKINACAKPLLFIFLLLVFTFGVWANWYMFKLFHLTLIGATCLLPYIGFIAGGLIAWALRQPRPRVIAICIETGVQNISVAMFALRMSLPQPLNDLSIVGTICSGTFTFVPLTAAFISYTIYKRCCKADISETEKSTTEEAAWL